MAPATTRPSAARVRAWGAWRAGARCTAPCLACTWACRADSGPLAAAEQRRVRGVLPGRLPRQLRPIAAQRGCGGRTRALATRGPNPGAAPAAPAPARRAPRASSACEHTRGCHRFASRTESQGVAVPQPAVHIACCGAGRYPKREGTGQWQRLCTARAPTHIVRLSLRRGLLLAARGCRGRAPLRGLL